MDHYQSILPEFDVFTPPPAPREPPGGQMLGAVRPKRAARWLMSPASAVFSGLGQDEPAAALAVEPPSTGHLVVGLLILTGLGYLCYEVGTAMAPAGSKKVQWGIVGIPAGLLAGPLGLGAMAVYANHGRG